MNMLKLFAFFVLFIGTSDASDDAQLEKRNPTVCNCSSACRTLNPTSSGRRAFCNEICPDVVLNSTNRPVCRAACRRMPIRDGKALSICYPLCMFVSIYMEGLSAKSSLHSRQY